MSESIEITYRGENGDGWVPKSQRDLWNYAVRTGQVVVPDLDDGGPANLQLNAGETVGLAWIPPEYAGRLVPMEPPPQPVYFALGDVEAGPLTLRSVVIGSEAVDREDG